MSYRPEYLQYLYGNRQNMEYEPVSEDSSSSSSSTESWEGSSDSEEETTTDNPNEIPQPLWRPMGIFCHRKLFYRISKERPDDGAGEIFLTRQNPSGSARMEKFYSRKKYDMFAWLSSTHRKLPTLSKSAEETLLSTDRDVTLPLATRYRNLKQAANQYVGVYRSKIHGRGLFSLIDIEPGEMVIEFVGEVIRSEVSDIREKYYRDKEIGHCILRIDEDFTIDGTMQGNVSRFINHSCEPNCYTKVVEILGKQHIIIFAQSRIKALDEITYDYCLPSKGEKIECNCGTETCRKFLN